MTTSHETIQKSSRLSGGMVAGGILILIGLLILSQNLFHLEFAFLPVLSAIFLAAGLLQKNTGLLVPGSILAGVNAGVTLMGGQYLHTRYEFADSGVFMLCIAGGFVLISLLSTYTNGLSRWARWPLFPAAVLALLGGALLSGQMGLQLLALMSYAWPVILILIGASLILRRR